MSSIIWLAFCTFLTAGVAWGWYEERHRYLGLGIILDYRADDGCVWIVSSLLQSPAGRAKVPTTKLLKYNGTEMDFKSKEEFKTAWEQLKPLRIGDVGRCTFEKDGRVVEVALRAEIIQRPLTFF